MSMTLDVYFLKLFLAAVGEKKLVFDEVFYLITPEMFVLSLLLKFYFLLGHLIFVLLLELKFAKRFGSS